MRKMTIFQLGLFLFSARMMSLNAQVRIGADADPHAGAVLDLTNTINRGLLLPRVSLDDFAAWTHDGGQALGGNPSQATGMTVYNNNKFALDGAGIYVWDGSKWNGIYAQGKAGTVIPAPNCNGESIPSVVFAPYNLGANIAKLDSIATIDKISKTKAAIRCSYIDFDAVIGDLYQWGRITDGHQDRNSTKTLVLLLNAAGYNTATGQVMNETSKKNFIAASSSPYDWQRKPNNNLWGNGNGITTAFTGSSGVPHSGAYYQSTEWQIPSNNPCPAGFRVPTQDEWERIANYDCNPANVANAITINTGSVSSYDMADTGLTWVRVKSGYASNESWSSGEYTGWAIYKTSDWNAAGANYKDGSEFLYASGAPEPLLFLPAAGYRDKSGNLSDTGASGRYWSSSVNGNNSWNLLFNSSEVEPNSSNFRVNGFSVRCVAE